MRTESFRHDLPATPAEQRVVLLGASAKPARYANQAQRLLMELGYPVIPVHPRMARIEGIDVVPDLRMIHEPVHTLTLYLGAERSRALIPDIVTLNPARVIFNPGSESAELEDALRAHHIDFLHGCTLVMLRTRQF
jgi:predicted CoA-binding protein